MVKALNTLNTPPSGHLFRSDQKLKKLSLLDQGISVHLRLGVLKYNFSGPNMLKFC